MMTEEERKSLAEQLDANPLWHEILDEIESNAVETMIYAETELDRVVAQWRARSARAFREDCQARLRSTPRRKGGIA